MKDKHNKHRNESEVNASDFEEEPVVEKNIDLVDIWMKLWRNRKKMMWWCIGGAVAGLIIAFSIPRSYTTETMMAPEIQDASPSSSKFGSLAALAGLTTAAMNGTDAVYPLLYPDVVQSVPFITGLFDVEVELTPEDDEKVGKRMTVQQYYEEEVSSPWWMAIIKLPFKLIELFKDDEEEGASERSTFRLTKDEWKLYKSLSKNISVDCDKKTSVLTLSVTAQDPLVSAILADTVMSRLQEYITDYRTNKARRDLEYAQQINKEAQATYYKRQKELADYIDRNHGIVFRSALIDRDRLENETTLAFNLYNQTSLAVQSARAKLQDITPVYAVISPVTVPEKPSAPRKVLILVAFTFLGFMAGAFWILMGKSIWLRMKKTPAEEEKPAEEAGDTETAE